MKSHTNRPLRFGAAAAAFVCAIFFAAQSAPAVDITFRNFSPGGGPRSAGGRVCRQACEHLDNRTG